MKEFFETSLVHMDKVDITVFSLIKIALIFFISYLLLFGFRKLLKFQAKKRHIEYGDVYSIYQIVKYIIIVGAIIMTLDLMGINTTILLTSSAALLVGVGLGLQNIFKDFLSGIVLLFGKVIRVHDIVQVDNEIGKILEINLRATKIITRDNTNMLIPNSKFVEENVINWTLDEKNMRIRIEVGVAYGSDTELVKNILLKVALNNDDVLKDPKPFVRFNNFGDSSLDFQLFVWSNNIFGMENLKSDIRFQIDQEFRKNHVEIPFPQRTVWMQNKHNDEKNN